MMSVSRVCCMSTGEVKTFAGTVLKMRSNLLLISRYVNGCTPNARICMRSAFLRAAQNTSAPIPRRIIARFFPMRPNPVMRHFAPFIVPGYSRIAMPTAPSAVGIALPTASSSRR